MRISTISMFCFGSLVLTLVAQTPAGDIFGSGIIRPPAPPFITTLGLAGSQKTVYDSSLLPKGHVAKVVWQEFHVDTTGTSRAPALSSTMTTEFDNAGRVVNQTTGDSVSERRTVTTYENGKRHTRTTTFLRAGKVVGRDFWERWTYDESGRIVDFRRGRGDALENHFTNVHYDASSRLTSLEYHQGSADELQERTEYTYEDQGRTIHMVESDARGEPFSRMTTIVDSGRVLHATFADRDWKTHQWSAPQRVTFHYDDKGRLVSQVAETQKLGEGGDVEHAIPPGAITISFDDAKHTRKISYADWGEPFESTVELDETGAAIASAIATGRSSFQMVVECSSDAHGNWTECKRWVGSGASRQMNGLFRRTITYR